MSRLERVKAFFADIDPLIKYLGVFMLGLVVGGMACKAVM